MIKFNKIFIQLENQGIVHHYGEDDDGDEEEEEEEVLGGIVIQWAEIRGVHQG